MADGQADLPERVDDQPGRIAIWLREEGCIRRAGRLKWYRRLTPPPGAERLQGPASIIALTPLHLGDERCALRAGQHVMPMRRGQQEPHPIEEALRGVLFLQIPV